MADKTLDQKIDDLAAMTQRGFEAVDNRFDAVDKRFDAMDNRFDEMDKRLDRIEFHVSGHDRRIDTIEDKLRQLATKVGLKFN